jgi:hypothetical protein
MVFSSFSLPNVIVTILDIIHGPIFYLKLADYPALPGYLFIPIFHQTGKGMNSIYRVKSK